MVLFKSAEDLRHAKAEFERRYNLSLDENVEIESDNILWLPTQLTLMDEHGVFKTVRTPESLFLCAPEVRKELHITHLNSPDLEDLNQQLIAHQAVSTTGEANQHALRVLYTEALAAGQSAQMRKEGSMAILFSSAHQRDRALMSFLSRYPQAGCYSISAEEQGGLYGLILPTALHSPEGNYIVPQDIRHLEQCGKLAKLRIIQSDTQEQMLDAMAEEASHQRKMHHTPTFGLRSN